MLVNGLKFMLFLLCVKPWVFVVAELQSRGEKRTN